MEEIATARGSLYPFGNPQERVLNFAPFLARYGQALIADMLTDARRHAAAITRSSRRGHGAEAGRQTAERTR
jgi:hypothetical protein